MIEASCLSKFYGAFIAIQNVSFGVPPGQVAAFVGPNGAGKTTTMRILTGYQSPSEGTARLAGMAAERLGQPAVLGELLGGVVLGVTFLQEQLTWQVITGAILIIASLAVANWHPAKSPAPGKVDRANSQKGPA